MDQIQIIYICIVIIISRFIIVNMLIINRVRNAFKQPKYSAAFTAINMLLGVGPIIIPEPFFEAGFVLSISWMAIILLLSFNSAMYIGQSIQKISKHMNPIVANFSSIDIDNRDSLLEDEEQPSQQLITSSTVIKTYDHIQQFKILYGEKWKLVPAISISIYLFGVSISKCIMTGKTLSKLLADIPVLDTFQFWLGVFFVSGAAFSFKSIDKTKALQTVIITVRFISILLMIIGAIIIIVQNGKIQSFIPATGNGVFNFEYFGDIFSNLVFSFLFHHSMPGITKQLKYRTEISGFIKIAFMVAGTAMVIIPITAIMAFGNNLLHPETHMLGESHSLIYYNEDFKGRLDFIYYIVSFYVFLNVAAFSVYIIVIRTNVLAIFKPEIDANQLSKTTLIFSAGLLGIILVVSYTLRNYIQVALSFTGGIFGCIILFFLPCLEVYKARQLRPAPKSFLNSYKWMPLVIMAFGGIFMIFNLFLTVRNLAS